MIFFDDLSENKQKDLWDTVNYNEPWSSQPYPIILSALQSDSLENWEKWGFGTLVKNKKMINEIKKVNDVKDSIVKYIAAVTSDKDGSPHEYEIDGYTYHQIRKINNGTWDYKSNIKIPVITIK